MTCHPASFRDPSGYVLERDGRIFRTISAHYKEEWEYITGCGLLAAAQAPGQCLAHTDATGEAWDEMQCADLLTADTWKLLAVDRVDFISYPYEWCFSQLKDAALLTIDLHLLALRHGCVLKDASAYNVQFVQGKPVFIDLLSFERRHKEEPWQAYGQFCRHFLAPLALMAYGDLRLGLLSRQWIDGIPLDLASDLLPWRSRFSPSLFMHLHLHAKLCRDHAGDGTASTRKTETLTLRQMTDVAEALRRAVVSLRPPKRDTEWGDYYTDTNYSSAAMAAKEACVADVAARYPGAAALDLGANTGHFSALVAPHFRTVLAVDGDALAVECSYRAARPGNVLPLVVDLSSPSPALGWALRERVSFTERCRADLVLGLALCHHLVISAGIPLPQLAAYMAELVRPGGHAVVEFIPKEDSQVQRMLASRDDIFSGYTLAGFMQAFTQAGFTEVTHSALPDSLRTVYVWKNKTPVKGENSERDSWPLVAQCGHFRR